MLAYGKGWTSWFPSSNQWVGRGMGGSDQGRGSLSKSMVNPRCNIFLSPELSLTLACLNMIDAHSVLKEWTRDKRHDLTPFIIYLFIFFAKGHRPTLYLAAKASISIVNYNQETKQSLKSIQFLSSILHALFHMWTGRKINSNCPPNTHQRRKFPQCKWICIQLKWSFDSFNKYLLSFYPLLDSDCSSSIIPER
jgi:hypothetical protein